MLPRNHVIQCQAGVRSRPENLYWQDYTAHSHSPSYRLRRPVVESSEAMRKVWIVGTTIGAILVFLALFRWLGASKPQDRGAFDGERAYADVLAQMELGPRVTGSPAGVAAGDLIAKQLEAAGWRAEFQPLEYMGVPARNVIGKANIGVGSIIILGAHYDSRRRADQDPQNSEAPVPGANDGASGVAVLLELARSLNQEAVPHEIWLAFFDAEDNGNLDGWDWIIGSRYMADNLTVEPAAMILLDMIGDADQQIYYEGNSDMGLQAQLWSTAAELGYGQQFMPSVRYTMTDDHIPFRSRGIPSVDLIDFDYPYWHTTADTADKVSADSLERVGRTLEAYLETEGAP
jgi:glutaminyl-peptide cyclotransferase